MFLWITDYIRDHNFLKTQEFFKEICRFKKKYGKWQYRQKSSKCQKVGLFLQNINAFEAGNNYLHASIIRIPDFWRCYPFISV
jgi:hypothetical protein